MRDASPWSDLQRPPLRALALRSALVTTDGPWTSLEVVASTGSTNEDLAALATAGSVGDGAILAADHQVAGRGRRDRTWTAPPRSSLAVSLLVVPDDVPQVRWSWLPLLVGVALAQALSPVAQVRAQLKWPNDVLVAPPPDAHPPDDEDWRKVAGVLAQVVSTPRGPGVVVGVGLNVSQRADELAVPTATSLVIARSATTDRDLLLRAALRSTGSWLRDWRTHRGDPVASGLGPAYRRTCRTLGRQVQVHLPGGSVLAGVASGVDDDGRLVVTPADGSPERALAAGDVVHVR